MMLSLLDRQFENTDSFPVEELQFTPRSVVALKRTGLTPEDLVFRSDDSFHVPGLSAAARRGRFEHFDAHRKKSIAMAVKERRKIENESMSQSHGGGAPSAAGGSKLEMRGDQLQSTMLRQQELALEALKARQKAELELMLKQEMKQAKRHIDHEADLRKQKEEEEAHKRELQRIKRKEEKRKYEREQARLEQQRQEEQLRAEKAAEAHEQKRIEEAKKAEDEKRRKKEARRRQIEEAKKQEEFKQQTAQLFAEYQAKLDEKAKRDEEKAMKAALLAEERRKASAKITRMKRAQVEERTVAVQEANVQLIAQKQEDWERKQQEAEERLRQQRSQAAIAERRRQQELQAAANARQEIYTRMVQQSEEKRAKLTNKFTEHDKNLRDLQIQRDRSRLQQMEQLRQKQKEQKLNVERELRRQAFERDALREKINADMNRAATVRQERAAVLEKARRLAASTARTRQQIAEIRESIRQQGRLSEANRQKLEALIPGCTSLVAETTTARNPSASSANNNKSTHTHTHT